MQKIPLNLAAPEMILARDVFRSESPAGIPVCGKGTVLNESLISRLKQMSIQSIYVEGHPVTFEGEASLEEQLQDLEKRFSKTLDNRRNLLLLDIYRQQIRCAMGEQGE
jgi:hypothetical protein